MADLTTFRADCLELWEPQPPGTLRDCPGIALHFYLSTTSTELTMQMSKISQNMCDTKY
jgi:hypothetical protein